MLAWIEKWQVRIDSVMATACAILVVFMMTLGTADVLGRYLLNSPIPGTYEITKFAMGGVAFLGLAYVQYAKGHITVPIIYQRLPAKAAKIFDLIFLIAIFATALFITWFGARNALQAWQAGDTTIGLVELPIGPAKMVVPVGAGLLCLRVLSQIFTAITGMKKGSRRSRSTS